MKKDKDSEIENTKISYAHTVILPETPFSMRADKNFTLEQQESLENLYYQQELTREDHQQFVLQFGPPFANGDLHIGHFLNLTLKDFYVRQAVLSGKRVNMVLGFDCHGLPIESKVEAEETKKGNKNPRLDMTHFRKLCRDFANGWIDKQMATMRKMGVFADYKNVYRTMDDHTEASIMNSILTTVRKNYVIKGFKPVWWSPSEQTTLAEAEMEYKDKTSNTVFIGFKLQNENPLLKDSQVVCWTTTPWTLPANKAVAFSKDAQYTILESNHGDRIWVAEARVADFLKKMEKSAEKITKLRLIAPEDYLPELSEHLRETNWIIAEATILRLLKVIEKKEDNNDGILNLWAELVLQTRTKETTGFIFNLVHEYLDTLIKNSLLTVGLLRIFMDVTNTTTMEDIVHFTKELYNFLFVQQPRDPIKLLKELQKITGLDEDSRYIKVFSKILAVRKPSDVLNELLKTLLEVLNIVPNKDAILQELSKKIKSVLEKLMPEKELLPLVEDSLKVLKETDISYKKELTAVLKDLDTLLKNSQSEDMNDANAPLNWTVGQTHPGSIFMEAQAEHLFLENHLIPLLPADFIETNVGTGFVHIAPSHGEDDYHLGRQNDLEISDIFDDYGTYKDFVPVVGGLNWLKVDDVIKTHLAGQIWATESYLHSYPHSWRSGKPLMCRAIPQWFIDLDNDNKLREHALNYIKAVNWIPGKGENRITSMVKNRGDWCVSRQRSWGVPLPFVMNAAGDIRDETAVLNKIKQFIYKDKNSVDRWFESDAQNVLEELYQDGDTLVKDIVDVWFESGTVCDFSLKQFNAAPTASLTNKLSLPVDLYLEGSDQHRGWFQSSLLVSSILHNKAPFKNILTHGFIMDERGDKISKSKGNAKMSLTEMIDFFGVDVLRLWVLSSDFTEDVKLSDTLLNTMQEKYRKFRNVLRYLMGNLKDFDFARDHQTYDKLGVLDKWMLHQLHLLVADRQHRSTTFDFSGQVQKLYEWCSFELSTLYFDSQKDTLYCEAGQSQARLNVLTVFNEIFNVFVRLLMPIIPLTIQEAYNLAPAGTKIFMAQDAREVDLLHEDIFSVWVAYDARILHEWKDEKAQHTIDKLLSYRHDIMSVFEKGREYKWVQDGLSAQLSIYSAEFFEFTQENKLSIEFLCQFFGFSQILLNEAGAVEEAEQASENYPWGRVSVKKALGYKCSRCRKRSVREELCPRCVCIVA